MTVQATLYKSDPRFVENGIPGTKLTIDDAYLDIDEIHLDNMFEQTEFQISAKESIDGNSKTLLPIRDKDRLEYSYLSAYGFLFMVLSVSWKDETKSILNIQLRFEPNEAWQSLTAKYIGDNKFELEREYSYPMPVPAGIREYGKDPSLIKFDAFDPKQKNLKVSSIHKNVAFASGERVKVMVNWRPDQVGYGSIKK